jgi:AraC-like DNA-binding protein
VGPNLPHAWQSRSAVRADEPHRALVLWFTPEWARGLTSAYPELGSLQGLLAAAARGLSFGAEAAHAAQQRILGLVDAAPAARWLGLVEVLLLLAADTQRTGLALRGFTGEDAPRERARLERVLRHLHEHYTQPIALAALSELAAMSDSQLQRVFRRCTRMTVGEYVAQLRIGRACALLLESERPIAQVAEAAGYAQASYFSRQFRELKGMTPATFRRRFAAHAASGTSERPGTPEVSRV